MHHDKSRIRPQRRIQKMAHPFFVAEHDRPARFQLRGDSANGRGTADHYSIDPAIPTGRRIKRTAPASTGRKIRASGKRSSLCRRARNFHQRGASRVRNFQFALAIGSIRETRTNIFLCQIRKFLQNIRVRLPVRQAIQDVINGDA